jgi:hypothetical protein
VGISVVPSHVQVVRIWNDRPLVVALTAAFGLLAYGIFTHLPRQVVPGDSGYADYIDIHVALCVKDRLAASERSKTLLHQSVHQTEITCRLAVTEFDKSHPESRPYRY